MLWQLQKLSTNEPLSKKYPALPENWGPIFGLKGVKDRLHDLSWLGDAYADMGWVEVEGSVSELAEPTNIDPVEDAENRIQAELASSEWAVSAGSGLTKAQKRIWVEYRKALHKLKNNLNPENISFPIRPE
jgi:hypothetical protein